MFIGASKWWLEPRRRVGQRSTTPLLAELQPGDSALLAIENLADLQLQNLELDDEDTDSFVLGSDD